MGAVEKAIVEILEAIAPTHLEVRNESFMHAVPEDSETHFKVVIVSDRFDGIRSVRRHQMVYRMLSQQIAGSVHALALHTYTSKEWQDKTDRPPDSPDCLGGGD